MKTIVAATVCVLAALPAFGAPMQTGATEARVEIGYDVTPQKSDLTGNDDTAHLTLQGALGYYLTDGVQVGIYVSQEQKNWESYWGVSAVWGLGVFGEYNFLVHDRVVPFVSLGVGGLDGDAKSGDTVCAGTLSAGLKFFVTELLAVSAQVNGAWASDEVFDFQRTASTDATGLGTGEATDFSASVAVRFLFY